MKNTDIRDRLATAIINLRNAHSTVKKAKDCISDEGIDKPHRAIMQLGAVEERLRDIDQAQTSIENYLLAFISDIKEEIEKENKHD